MSCKYITLLGCILFLWSCGGSTDPVVTVTKEEAAPRPNLLIILADDMGFSDIGCYGSEIETPNIDRLAANGLRFNQFYNASKCCPTRASLLTGLYHHAAGMGLMVTEFGNKPEKKGAYQGYLNKQSVTLAEALKPAGYKTYMAGKWHVGENPEDWPMRRGFDRYFGLISGASSYYEIITKQKRVRMLVKENEPWTPPAEDFYMTDAFTDYAIERLDEHKANYNDEPFFLNLCYTAPHWPLHAPAEDIAKYAGRYQQGWDATRQQRYQRQQQLGIIDTSYQLPPRPVSVEAWAIVKDKATWQRRMEVYAAMIDRMDQNIGKVLAKLEANGQLENTLILFMSDNGASDENVTGRNLNNPDAAIGAKGSYVAYREPWAMVSNTPFRRYKGREFMGGIASPLIAHWPAGIAARGDITQQQAHVIDVMPTFLALAGAEYPTNYGGQKIKSMHGRSLVSHFKQQAPTEERTLYFEFKGSKAVIKGDWKLVNNRETKQWELYNLQSDPTEMNNLFDKHPDKFLELRTMHGQWERGVGVFDIEY